ncbi:MAG: V-type ATP synthase subunit B [Gammaproteobacteria bacterium]|nr:MAG: V-type ATP synthase subunit B [Gammaproteobacteria bacterium]
MEGYATLYAEGASGLEGPLLFLKRRVEVGLGEGVVVEDGRPRLGRIASLDEEVAVVEVLEATSGLSLKARVRHLGEPLYFSAGPGILGRVLNGVGAPLDGGPPLAEEVRLPIQGQPFNPAQREAPKDFIETGITAIDLLNSLVRGQKLPLFSGGGLPHDRIAIHIATHARLRQAAEPFAIVFAAIGVSHDSAETFARALEESGALGKSVLFLNLASDSSVQRLLTPRFALTAAEYLSFAEGRHVLAILSDMTAYCEALREVSASLGEIPGRKGYPGYLYSDLASLYERAGRLRGKRGSLTQLPILTMPADDITHPIPDLTGYITEGQIVLDRELDHRGIYPPIQVLPSLSRLMKDGIGEGYTHADHPALAAQLYASYARAGQARLLASVVGEEGLTPLDRQYLAFGKRFEEELLHQGEPRTFEESFALGWEVLRTLPPEELTRLSDEQIARYLK